jgi:hypothetical protein
MAQQAIVIANHKDKTATLSFIDEELNKVAHSYKNEPLVNLRFPYEHIKEYDFLFESLEKIEPDKEKYLFKIL